MKQTKISTLIGIAGVIAIAGEFLIRQMVGQGLPAPTTGLNIVFIQPSLAVILTLSAIPMIRYRAGLKKFLDNKGPRPKPVDPAYAVRTLALAKAMSLTGSIFVGWQLAILFYQLSLPEATSLIQTVLGLIGAIIMFVVGLVIENLFRVPPDRDGEGA